MSVAAEADSDAQHGGLDAQQARLRGMRQAHQHLDQTPLPNTFTKHFSADTHPHLAVVDSADLVYFRRHPHRAGLIAVSTQAPQPPAIWSADTQPQTSMSSTEQMLTTSASFSALSSACARD